MQSVENIFPASVGPAAGGRELSGAAGGVGALPAESAGVRDVQRFEQAFQTSQQSWSPRVPLAPQALSVGPVVAGPGLERSGAFVATLRDAAGSIGRDWTAVRATAADMIHRPFGPAALLSLQHQTMEATLRVDLASKLVQKSTQAVDQLVRIQ